jgi:undecaprenyl diphosphate synthase
MDGNGRWARRHHVPVSAGHRAGVQAVRRVIEEARDLGIAQLTLYSFSTENWSRPADEVEGLMRLHIEMIESEVPTLHKNSCRVVFVGRRIGLSEALLQKMRWAEELTAGNTRMILFIAFNYGGRLEIVDAVREALAEGRAPAELDERDVSSHLYSPLMRDPDLVIRTSGRCGCRTSFSGRRHILSCTSRANCGRISTRQSCAAPWTTMPPVSVASAAGVRKTTAGRRAAMLRYRVMVAIVGIPIGLAAVVLGGYYLFGLGLLLTIIGLHEYYTLLRPYRPNLLVGYAGGIAAVLGAYYWGVEGLLVGLAVLMIFTFFWSLFGELGAHLVGRMAMTGFGVIWVALGFAYVLLIRQLNHGMELTIMLLACTMVNDTFAYFVGRAFGRNKLAPRISPGKTIEGAIGGIVGSIVAALIVKIYSPWLTWGQALIFGLVIGVVGQCGDLFESAVKRDFRVKDSGKILPGHGGILDRFDAVLLAGFVTYWLAIGLLGDVVSEAHCRSRSHRLHRCPGAAGRGSQQGPHHRRPVVR